MNYTWTCLAILILCLESGCISFHHVPLDPQQTARQFESRTLLDPGLQTFMAENKKAPMPTLPATWDLQSLTLAAYYYHADLDIARAQWKVATAGIRTAQEHPNPTLSVGPEYASNPEPGFASWILGFSLDIPIETAGKRGDRITQAQALSDAARLHIAQTAWLVRGRVRTSLLALYAAVRSQEILHSQDLKLEENLKLYQRRSAEAFVSPLTLTQAEVLAGKTSILLADARRQELDARHQLAQAVGISIQALDAVQLALTSFDQPALIDPQAFAPLRPEALLRRPDLLEALANYAASEAALQLEIARQYPDIHLGPGYLYDQGTRKWGLAASSVLPVLNQNHGAIGEAMAKREQAAVQFMALQDQVSSQVDQAIADYTAARQKLETASTLLAVHSQLDQRLQKLLHPGDVSRLTLFRAQMDLDSTRLLASDALIQFHQAEVALEMALGQPLPGSVETLPNLEPSRRPSIQEGSHAQ